MSMIEQQDDAPPTDAHTAGDEPAPTRAARSPAARQVARRELPQYRVILHNDDYNEIDAVVRVLTRLTPLSRLRATVVTLYAHHHGEALVLITHKERAELYAAQFRSRRLTVSIEPDA